MTPFQLADLAEKTGFDAVATVLRSGTAEAGELYSAVLEALEPGSTLPKQFGPPSSSETVVWGKEATYNKVRRIDGTASDGTRFRLAKGRLWNLGVSIGWTNEKAAKEKWVPLVTGEKPQLVNWAARIMSSHDRPEDKAKWSDWLDPIVESESYSIQHGQLHFTPEERKAGKSAIHAALMVYNKAMETVEVRRFIGGKDARTPIEVTIPSGLTQGNFVVPRTALTWGPVGNEAPLDKVLGSVFIEVDIVKAKLPTKWHPQEWHTAVLTVQSFDGGAPVDVGVNAKWLAGIVGAIAGKGSVRYFATATKRGDPQPLSPMLVVGPDGTGAVIMPMRID